MITAVDTNVLLDLLIPHAARGQSSQDALTEAAQAGAVILSPPVYAELAVHFPGKLELDGFLTKTHLRVESLNSEALYRAGKAWQAYVQRRPRRFTCPGCGNEQQVQCLQCGHAIQPRQHVVTDFLIGAHAATQADRLLTRDRGYYATYFPALELA